MGEAIISLVNNVLRSQERLLLEFSAARRAFQNIVFLNG